MAPDAGGTAVTVVAASDTIVGAFRSAAVAAVLAIAVILVVALGRLRDAALVLAPLLLSATLTALVMVLLQLRLNYANIIALPLLLGVGVSFNIYFVMNWRAGRREMLASATARAVAFSALTTGTAFGSLALSGHPGTASMGALLLISLGCTLTASLVFVPAMLAGLERIFGSMMVGRHRMPELNRRPAGGNRRLVKAQGRCTSNYHSKARGRDPDAGFMRPAAARAIARQRRSFLSSC